jgi:hypothetical protein
MMVSTSVRTFVPVACKRFNAVKPASSAGGESRGATFSRASNRESEDWIGAGAAKRGTVHVIKKEKLIAEANFLKNHTPQAPVTHFGEEIDF